LKLGIEKFDALARVAQGTERQTLFEKMSAKYPMFAEVPG
jgi:hypothetical protein